MVFDSSGDLVKLLPTAQTEPIWRVKFKDNSQSYLQFGKEVLSLRLNEGQCEIRNGNRSVCMSFTNVVTQGKVLQLVGEVTCKDKAIFSARYSITGTNVQMKLYHITGNKTFGFTSKTGRLFREDSKVFDQSFDKAHTLSLRSPRPDGLISCGRFKRGGDFFHLYEDGSQIDFILKSRGVPKTIKMTQPGGSEIILSDRKFNRLGQVIYDEANPNRNRPSSSTIRKLSVSGSDVIIRK